MAARSFGATHTVNSREQDPVELVGPEHLSLTVGRDAGPIRDPGPGGANRHRVFELRSVLQQRRLGIRITAGLTRDGGFSRADRVQELHRDSILLDIGSSGEQQHVGVLHFGGRDVKLPNIGELLPVARFHV